MNTLKKIFGKFCKPSEKEEEKTSEEEVTKTPGSIDESFRIDDNSGSSPTAKEESDGVSDPEVPGLGISETEL